MDEKILVVYIFEQRGVSICRHSLEEGAEPVSTKVAHLKPTLSFAPVTDPETGVETLYPMVDGKKVFTTPILLDGEELLPNDSHSEKRRKMFEGISVKAQLVMPQLARRTHPEDKECRECELWNREVGVEELEKVTHVYQNGEAKMVREICEAMSVMYGKPLLTAKNVGYCPKNQELCGASTPACLDFEEKAPRRSKDNSDV